MTKPEVQYSDELATEFCLRLSDLGSVAKVCATEGMPSKASAFAWLRTKPSFLVMYTAAREDYAETVYDRMEAVMNEVPPKDPQGRTDMGAVRDKEVRLRALQWQLGRLSAKKYGDRVGMEVTGRDGAPLMPASDEMTPERTFEGLRRFAFLLHKIGLEEAKPAPAVPLRLVHVPKPVRPPPPWD